MSWTKRLRRSMTRSPLQTSSSLREFAEAPDAYLTPVPGVRVVDDERYYASLSEDGKWIGVCRLRFAPEEVPAVLAEVRALGSKALIGREPQRHDHAAALPPAGPLPRVPP